MEVIYWIASCFLPNMVVAVLKVMFDSIEYIVDIINVTGIITWYSI